MMAKAELTKDEKKLLKQMYWRSFTEFASVTPTKLGGSGVTYAMLPFINKYYQTEDERKQAMMRHNAYFNTTVATYPFILGIAASMEKENSEKPDFDSDSISAIKTSLMGPLSGLGDSVFWGVLRVIAAGIAIPLANQGNILAPIIFLLIFNIPTQLTRWFAGKLGYTLGSTYISDLYNSGLMSVLTKAASIVGITMVGAMTSSMVKFDLKWNMVMSGKTVMKSQEMLDSIFIGIIPLAFTMLCYWLIAKKNVSINKMIVGVIIIGIIASVLGIA
jgi:PTS system mannose-specific IID component